MPCLLYCISLITSHQAPTLTGVTEQPVVIHEAKELRVYWSEVATPDALLEGPSRKAAEAKYRQVLHELVAVVTPLSLPFPAIVESADGIEALLADRRDTYVEALTRLDGLVQYELIATWADEEGIDLATPVSGHEYLKRRQESEARVAAIDAKLRSVTAGIVRDWRSRRDRRNHLWYALLPRDAREQFVAALRSAGPSEGVRLRLSGPWPPDDFV